MCRLMFFFHFEQVLEIIGLNIFFLLLSFSPLHYVDIGPLSRGQRFSEVLSISVKFTV